MNLFEKVKIPVNTGYGTFPVEFTIISVINKPNEIYALLAQDRVCKGQYMVDKTWKLSKSIDLLTEL